MDSRDFLRHNFVFYDRMRLYPLLADLCGALLPAVREAASEILGEAPDGWREQLVAFVAHSAINVVAEVGRNGLARGDVRRLFRKELGFDLDRHVLMRGYRKDIAGEMLDPERNRAPAGQRFLTDTDALDSESFFSPEGPVPTRIYTQTEMRDDGDAFVARLVQHDVLSLGGPIPLDWLRQSMTQGGPFPYWYDIRKPTPYPERPTANRYPIQAPDGTAFDPRWNQVNYGLITKVGKQVLGEGRGTFLNFSGCNREGTLGASSLMAGIDEAVETLQQVRRHGADTRKDFQAVVEVPLTGGRPRIVAAQNLA